VMTIITKSAVSEKKDNELNKAKAAAISGDGEAAPAPTPAWGAETGGLPLDWYAQIRRRRLLSSVCAGLLVLWLLLASVIGGILLFRYIHRRPLFYGWCGAQYMDADGYGRPRFEKLQERLEIDPDGDYEKIEVPRFGPNRPAVFIHDFRENLTAIADVAGGQCFLKPLDRSHVAPPSSFIDLVEKMESGYYEQNTAVVREKYGVAGPPLTDAELRETGSWMIAQQCQDRRTFRLVRKWDDILALPQIDDPMSESDSDEDKAEAAIFQRVKREANGNSYRFFNGKEMVILDVLA